MLSFISRFLEIWNKPQIQWSADDKFIYTLGLCGFGFCFMVALGILLFVSVTIIDLFKFRHKK